MKVYEIYQSYDPVNGDYDEVQIIANGVKEKAIEDTISVYLEDSYYRFGSRIPECLEIREGNKKLFKYLSFSGIHFVKKCIEASYYIDGLMITKYFLVTYI